MNEKKITTIVLGILIVGLIASGLFSTTYSLFSNDVFGSGYEAYSTGLLAIEAKSKTDDISLTNALPITDEEGLQMAPYVFTIKNTGNLDYEFDVMLKSTTTEEEAFPSNLIKLQINGGEVITLANLTDGKLNTDKITLAAGDSIDFSIRIWLSIDTTNEYINRKFDSKIVTDGQAVYTETNKKIELLTTYIDTLYKTSAKTIVTNNEIEYNYASSVSLMNDRLGGTTADYDAGNIRYYGASPNNYIDIGDVYTKDTEINNFDKFYLYASTVGITDSSSCYSFLNCSTNYSNLGFEDETTCTAYLPNLLENVFKAETTDEVCGTTVIPAGTPKLYRIIGLFKDVELSDGTTKDLVKIMRDDPIGNFAWDLTYDETDGSSEYANNWRTSTLNSILNTNYYNLTTASYSVFDWNAYRESEYQTISYYNTTKDFSSIGLNSSLKDKIETVNWKLGGWNDKAVYSNQIYGYERGETVYSGMPTDWEGRIALMYPSDYGYATDFSQCSITLDLYGKEGCYDNDWIYDGYTLEWMLTPYSGNSVGAWFVYYYGNVLVNRSVYDGLGVRPVFYLDSELFVLSGTGTEEDPFVIN